MSSTSSACVAKLNAGCAWTGKLSPPTPDITGLCRKAFPRIAPIETESQMSSTRVQRAEHDGNTRSWSTPLKGIFRAGRKAPTPPVASLVRTTTPLSVYGQSPPLSQSSLRMTPSPARNRRISQSPIRSLFDVVRSRPSTPLRPPSTPPGAKRAVLQTRQDPELQSRSTLSLETQRAPLPKDNHGYGSPPRQSESHETPRRLTVDIQPSFRATDLDLNARLHSAPASPTSASTDLVHQYPFAKTNLKGKGKAVFQSEPELSQSYVNRWLQPRKDSDQSSDLTPTATASPRMQERPRDVPGKLYDAEPYTLAPVLRQWSCVRTSTGFDTNGLPFRINLAFNPSQESDARLEWDHGLDRYIRIPTYDILETPAAMGERQLTRMVIILPTYDTGLPADKIIINASNLTAIDVLRVIFSHYRQPVPAEDAARIPEFFKSRGFRQAYEKRLQNTNDRKREEEHGPRKIDLAAGRTIFSGLVHQHGEIWELMPMSYDEPLRYLPNRNPVRAPDSVPHAM